MLLVPMLSCGYLHMSGFPIALRAQLAAVSGRSDIVMYQSVQSEGSGCEAAG